MGRRAGTGPAAPQARATPARPAGREATHGPPAGPGAVAGGPRTARPGGVKRAKGVAEPRPRRSLTTAGPGAVRGGGGARRAATQVYRPPVAFAGPQVAIRRPSATTLRAAPAAPRLAPATPRGPEEAPPCRQPARAATTQGAPLPAPRRGVRPTRPAPARPSAILRPALVVATSRATLATTGGRAKRSSHRAVTALSTPTPPRPRGAGARGAEGGPVLGPPTQRPTALSLSGRGFSTAGTAQRPRQAPSGFGRR